MSPVYVIPLLLSVLVGLSLGIAAWSLWRVWDHRRSQAPLDTRHDTLWWWLVLAAFALGILVTYALLGLRF